MVDRRHMSIVEVHSPQPVVAIITDDERTARYECHATRIIETASFPGPSTNPLSPLPAIVVMMPLADILRIEWLSAT